MRAHTHTHTHTHKHTLCDTHTHIHTQTHTHTVTHTHTHTHTHNSTVQFNSFSIFRRTGLRRSSSFAVRHLPFTIFPVILTLQFISIHLDCQHTAVRTRRREGEQQRLCVCPSCRYPFAAQSFSAGNTIDNMAR